MLTADTITDQQIRDLAESTDDVGVYRLTQIAENERGHLREKARERIALILNAESPKELARMQCPDGQWWRLTRNKYSGIIALESMSDSTMSRPGPEAAWAFSTEISTEMLGSDPQPEHAAAALAAAIANYKGSQP